MTFLYAPRGLGKSTEDPRQEMTRVAQEATQAFMDKHFGGTDGGACGFAWVNVYTAKGNTREGREQAKQLKALGFKKSYDTARCYTLWNPSNMPIQSVDAKSAGAVAAANFLREEFDFKAYAGDRLD